MKRHHFLRYLALAVVVAWIGAMWLYESDDTRNELIRAFNGVYASGKWAKDSSGRGTSGPGSTLEITREYRAYLQAFIKSHHVTSVVDAGCGDWSFSHAIDWNYAHYLGVDISTEVIDIVKKRYESAATEFKLGNVSDSLPSADLLLCKDVLQHLPNEQVLKFIRNNLKKGKYKWAIITNDKGRDNHDIRPGEHRLIDLSAPPFGVKGLVDLPIKFGDEGAKTAQLLDLSQE